MALPSPGPGQLVFYQAGKLTTQEWPAIVVSVRPEEITPPNLNLLAFSPDGPVYVEAVRYRLASSSEGRTWHENPNDSFFGGAVTSQPSDVGALTDNTGAVADGTIVDVGAVPTQGNINGNFADLAAKVNGIRDVLRSLGLMA